jgi:hypothetical protein
LVYGLKLGQGGKAEDTGEGEVEEWLRGFVKLAKEDLDWLGWEIR